ncbi:ammonia channel protein [Skermanella stibiiresistens SB22]|uniref:Ammonium transporter n=1 Tax=Skermanella stibiiresistens SB22 TaxID=1385369 RepID=W9HEU4_9PROT|nr:ammonium transporter [Skermanella stibiiresistens]EWY42428.1 ammonia channel protein [Skermanella stibiiresistens SB22]
MSRLFAFAVPLLAAILGAVALPAGALAQTDAPTIDTGDTAWMLTSTALVLMMTIPGLALFYGGMVRKMNLLATVMQSFAICCLVAVIWVVVGYSIAFGNGGAYFGDFSKVLMAGMDMSAPFSLGVGTETPVPFTIPESVFVMFQMTFAIITPALITGAFADRMKFSAMLVFSGLWSIIVYSPIAHWVWHPNGFLFADGVLDFAGGTVVHINAGVAGLVAALVIGKRRGYPTEHFVPNNLVLSLIGASLLWVGWFGFNAGSAGGANGRAGMAMLVTMVAAASAALAWMFAEWIGKGKPSVLGIISGAIGGLVAITPASGFVDVGGSLVIGVVAGIICFWGATGLKHMMGYDDSLDAFGVHGVGGIVGAILTGVFAKEAIGGSAAIGLLEGNSGQVVTQIWGIAATIVWTAVASFILLKVIDVVIGLRVSEDVEREGLDLALHGEAVH